MGTKTFKENSVTVKELVLDERESQIIVDFWFIATRESVSDFKEELVKLVDRYRI